MNNEENTLATEWAYYWKDLPLPMRRIDRYMLKEMLTPAIIGGVMVLMLLVGNWLYVLLKYLYQGTPANKILLILLLRIPGVLMMSIPASLLLGTALAVNRLERDRELMSLRMAGVRLLRLMAPFVMTGILGAGLLYLLQEKIVPLTTHKAEILTRRLIYQTPTSFVQCDQVFKADNNHFVYVQQADPNTKTLRGVVICKIDQGPTWLLIPVAEYHQGKWIFKPDPVTHKEAEFYIFRWGSNPIYGLADEGMMDLRNDFFKYLSDEPTSAAELNFGELKSLMNGVRGGIGIGMNLKPSVLRFQINRKLADPLAALVAVLIAIPLSVHFGRSGGYTGLLLSVIVAFCFVVSQQWTQVLAETSRVNPVLAAWLPDAAFGLLGLGLLLKEE